MDKTDKDVEALVAAGDVAGLQALAAGADKAVAKAAKKGLHVLRTRGVRIEAARPAGASLAPRAIGDRAEAWTCIPDANGERLVIVTVPASGGDFDAITVHLGDEKGLMQVAHGRGPRKHALAVRKSFEGSGGFAADVSVERAAALIERAYQTTLARGGSPPPDFASARRVLPKVAAASDDLATHPARAAVPPLDGPLGDETAEGLHDLPIMRRWVPSREQLMALEQSLAEVAASQLTVDETQRRRAWFDAIDRAIAAAWDAAGRARWARRLLDAAEVFAAGGLTDDAAALVAQADRLGAEGFDPLADRFARKLVEKVTAGLTPPPAPGAQPAKDDQPATPGGLIVAP